MRNSTPVLALVGTVVGLAAAAVGYDLATSPLAPVGTGEPVAAVDRTRPAAPPAPRTTFAPCEPPARLQQDECVTHVWRTEVVHDAPPTPATLPTTQQATQRAAGAVSARPSEDDDRDDDHDDHGEDRDDDGEDRDDDGEDRDDDGEDRDDDHDGAWEDEDAEDDD